MNFPTFVIVVWAAVLLGLFVGWCGRVAYERMNKDTVSVDGHGVVTEVGQLTVTVALPIKPTVQVGDIVRFAPTYYKVRDPQRAAEYRRYV